MNKDHILAEIKRASASSGGIALGVERLFKRQE